jgi:hypothetical protein
VDPRTFLPARPLPLGTPPAPGEAAASLPVRLEPGQPTVVAFLRHTGCPFAEATMRMLRTAAADTPSIRWIAISHSPQQAADRWCRAVGGAGGVQLVNDPGRHTYAAWGLGRTSLGHFMGRRSLASVVLLARQGVRNRHPHGTRWQSAGTFAVDGQGIVRWRHLPAHAGELPDLGAAARSLR